MGGSTGAGAGVGGAASGSNAGGAGGAGAGGHVSVAIGGSTPRTPGFPGGGSSSNYGHR
ncbi:hypothetical protein DFQ27_003085, partial [Actinomortierella ambigua]